MDPVVIPFLVAAIVVVFLVAATVRIVPQARRYNIERFGRYRRTLQPGLNFVVPVADRVNTKLDVREQVYSSAPKPVITETPTHSAISRRWVFPHLRNRRKQPPAMPAARRTKAELRNSSQAPRFRSTLPRLLMRSRSRSTP